MGGSVKFVRVERSCCQKGVVGKELLSERSCRKGVVVRKEFVRKELSGGVVVYFFIFCTTLKGLGVVVGKELSGSVKFVHVGAE